MARLTASETAARLGVKVETVYAYVSRGVLASQRSVDGRTSTFADTEVEALARRGRPRRSTRPAAVEVTIDSALTRIEDHRLRFRGHDAVHLARSATFEQVAELLWTGALPTRSPRWEATPLPLAVDVDRAEPVLPGLTDRLRVAIAVAPALDPLRGDLRLAAVLGTARTVVATLVGSLPPVAPNRGGAPSGNGGRGAGADHGDRPVPQLALPAGDPAHRGTMAGQLWNRLTPAARPRPGLVAVLNAAMVLLADHEMATSTLAARVAASTRADPYAVVAAGMATVSGPLHGGASRAAWHLLEAAGSRAGAGRALADMLAAQGLYPGFGHALYPDGDPRAVFLLDLLRDAAGGTAPMASADAVIAMVRSRVGVEPNVDFALATLARVTSMPADAGEAIFTIARSAGWLAHAIEEYREAPLRFRSRAVYVEQPNKPLTGD